MKTFCEFVKFQESVRMLAVLFHEFDLTWSFQLRIWIFFSLSLLIIQWSSPSRYFVVALATRLRFGSWNLIWWWSLIVSVNHSRIFFNSYNLNIVRWRRVERCWCDMAIWLLNVEWLNTCVFDIQVY